MYMQLINKYKIHNPHFENNLKYFYSLFSGKLSKKKNFTQTQQWMLFESFWMNQKKNVVCSQPSSWIISRALSNQNIIGLTNISIVLKPEPKRTTVCKRMEWVRSLLKFQLDDRAKGSDMKHWKMLFEAFSSRYTSRHTHFDKIFK